MLIITFYTYTTHKHVKKKFQQLWFIQGSFKGAWSVGLHNTRTEHTIT
jgi:hypothetical protein